MSRLALSLAFSLATLGAAHAERVEKPFAPEIGSRWTIEEAQDGVSTRAGGVRATETIRQTSELVFEEKLADGWRVSFVQKEISIGGDAPGVAIVGPALETLKGVVISASLDARGKPVAVLNLEETRGRMKEIVEKAAERLKSKPQTANALRSLLTSLIVLDGAQAAETYLAPLLLMSAAQGTGLKPGEDRTETEAKPNPLGGDPIVSVSTTRIAAPGADGVTVVTRTEAFEPESLKKTIEGFARKLLKDLGSDAKISQADIDRLLPMIEVSNDTTSTFEVRDGMVRKATQSNATRAAAMGQTFGKEEKRTLTISPTR